MSLSVPVSSFLSRRGFSRSWPAPSIPTSRDLCTEQGRDGNAGRVSDSCSKECDRHSSQRCRRQVDSGMVQTLRGPSGYVGCREKAHLPAGVSRGSLRPNLGQGTRMASLSAPLGEPVSCSLVKSLSS